MKLLKRIRTAYWFARGALASSKGEYERAAVYLDRSVAAGKATGAISAYRALHLMLAGRRDESLSAFREIAASAEPGGTSAKYARAYAQMFVAYFDDHLIEADRIAAELKHIDGPKTLLPPMDRPSLVAANSLLEAMGVQDVDPLSFRDERSGVRWMEAVKAYSNGEPAKALEHIEQAEAVRAATPAQKALKGGLLIHLKRPDDADQIFGEVISELAGANGIDERYILLFCELHRPSNGGSNDPQLLAQASQLRAQSSLSDFLPLDLLDEGRIQTHFRDLNRAYGNIIIRPGEAKTSL